MITDIDQLDLNKRYTYADYLTWQFKERVELIMGRIFRMSPAPSRQHQKISTVLQGEIYLFLKNNSCSVFAAPFDVRLPVSREEGKTDTVVQPDISVICDESKLDDRGCNGSPDLVIEILSPGNTRKEMKEKFELYEASLIPEYWMVDPEHESITVYTLSDAQKYTGSKPYVEGEQVLSSVLKDFHLEVKEVFG